eukprot:3010743-Amphidinium_carterae.1
MNYNDYIALEKLLVEGTLRWSLRNATAKMDGDERHLDLEPIRQAMKGAAQFAGECGGPKRLNLFQDVARSSKGTTIYSLIEVQSSQEDRIYGKQAMLVPSIEDEGMAISLKAGTVSRQEAVWHDNTRWCDTGGSRSCGKQTKPG